ncbi:MAG: MBL fold metallo-hydrolase [Verrucomicrobiota bacterium]
MKSATSIKFWGVRGSVPTPGPSTVRYGGNTSCVEVRVGKEIIILDAGTGLRLLGNKLLADSKGRTLNLNLLLTHTHWDHIQGLPFFGPIYNSRCRLKIWGSEGARKGLVGALTGQMESTYFPVPFDKLPSNITIEELKTYDFRIGPAHVTAHRASHPGVCVGYRLATPQGDLVFFPDTETRLDAHDTKMIEFIRGADVLILDSQYDKVEYKQRVGWGHGCVDDSVLLAVKAGVKTVCLFHHDAAHDDHRIDTLVKHSRQLAAKWKSKLNVIGAREGLTIQLGGKS